MDVSKEFLDKWRSCQGCSLGEQRVHRIVYDKAKRRITPSPVLALGYARGVMFVGDPVGATEESLNLPLSNPKYDLIRVMLREERIPYHFTHALLCRSCVASKDEAGRPYLRDGLPLWKDGAPPKDAMDLCKQRLHEEIYLMDPLLIVALGKLAFRALTGEHVSENDRGKIFTVEVQGKSTVPVLNAKGVWGRKVRGVMVRPVAPRMVKYPVYLTGSLDKVVTYSASQDPDREPLVFVKDLKRIAAMWRLYKEVSR